MDKERNKTNANKNAPSSGRCKKPMTCTHLRSLRQQQIQSGKSAQALFREPNFQAHRSDDDIFFDCQSVGDSDINRDGNSCKTYASCRTIVLNKSNLTNKPSSTKSAPDFFKGSGSCNTSASNKFDDPEAVRAALERAANATQMLLKNFEKNKRDCKCPCKATLEITTRLIIDPKANSSRCRLQGRPVTVQMPLQFDPNTGDMATCQPRSLHNVPSNLSEPSRKGRATKKRHGPFYDTTDIEDDDILFKGTCAQSKESLAPVPVVPAPVPVPLPLPVLVPVPIPVPKPGTTPTSVSNLGLDRETDVEQLEEIVPLTTEESKSIVQIAELPPEKSTELEPMKKYFLALPQHKEFSNCSPCRFEPSPIMDEEGNIFCPGNCGCCQCPWKTRSLDENRDRINVKVCRCVQRGTIFSSFDRRETCSQTSYFDFCPCREKAEAKFLELYHSEMWSTPTKLRGREVQLSEIKELMTPPQSHDK